MTIDTPDWGPGETLEKVQSTMLLAYPARLWHISVITEQRAIDEGRAWLRDLMQQDRSLDHEIADEYVPEHGWMGSHG